MTWYDRILFPIGAFALSVLASVASVLIVALLPVMILMLGVFTAFYIAIFGEFPKTTPPDTEEYTQ